MVVGSVEYPEDMKEMARRLFARTHTIPEIKEELEMLFDEVPKCIIINQWMHEQAVPNEEKRILKVLNDAEEGDAFAAACSFLTIHNFGLLIRASPRKHAGRPRAAPTGFTDHEDGCFVCDSRDFRLRRMDELEDLEDIRKNTGTEHTRYYKAYCSRCGKVHNSYLVHCPVLTEHDRE